MLLSLERTAAARGWTLGRLRVDGRFACYTCEDVVRAPGVKVAGQTAIPPGRYRIIVSASPRFSKLAGHEVRTPRLVGVPDFEGILIHPGNGPEHTEGCILPGLSFNDGGVLDSRAAYDRLLVAIESALAAGEQVWIEITNPPTKAVKPGLQEQRSAPAAPRASVAPPDDLVGG